MTLQRKIMTPGPAGLLEIVIDLPFTSSDKLLGIICHPHPLFEGSMNNKVVTTIARAFNQLNIVPLRFNFRGVGRSEGHHGYVTGELEDLRAVIKWVKAEYPDYKLLLAGFSFGSYIAARVATEIYPEVLISIAPPVHHNDFKSLPPITFPWIIVQGEADEVVPPDQVFNWVDSLKVKPILIKMPNVSHFFHGNLTLLCDKLIQGLKSVLRFHSV